jgi:hypothetical protein
MQKQDYNVTITLNVSTEEAFKGITSVSKWWTEDVEGSSKKLNDVFTVHFGETFITLKVVELIPEKKIVWHVIDCYKHWLKNKKEWKDTTIIWEISRKEDGTQITLTHIGLVPGIECYGGCEKAWDQYIKENLFNSLKKRKGTPELK